MRQKSKKLEERYGKANEGFRPRNAIRQNPEVKIHLKAGQIKSE